MKIQTKTISVQTKGFTDIINITDQVQRLIDLSSLWEGNVTVFVPGSTAGVSTIEFEPGLVKDLPELFEKIAPMDYDYHHHQTWGDHNGSAHCRAPLVGPSLVVPFLQGRLLTGTWQQIVLFDFDDCSRNRELICQIIGKEKNS